MYNILLFYNIIAVCKYMVEIDSFKTLIYVYMSCQGHLWLRALHSKTILNHYDAILVFVQLPIESVYALYLFHFNCSLWQICMELIKY